MILNKKRGSQPNTASPNYSECNRAVPHARSGRNGRQEGRECSYYNLHCNLNDTLFHFLFNSFLILIICASSAAPPLAGVWHCRKRLSMGSGTDVKSPATFSSGPDPSERLRRKYPLVRFPAAIAVVSSLHRQSYDEKPTPTNLSTKKARKKARCHFLGF